MAEDYSFEALHPKSQAKVLAKYPDFHSFPESRKASIAKSRHQTDKNSAARTERNNRDKTRGAEAIIAISQAQSAVRARGGDAGKPIVEEPHPADASRAARGQKPEEKTELSTLYKNIQQPEFSLDADNPYAKNAVDYNPDFGNLMHDVSLKLEEHRLKNEGESDNVSDIGTHITNGWEAMGEHHDAHMLGDVTTAKAKIKEAAGHFSQAASLINHRYGNTPKVLINGMPEQGRYAMGLGDLAVHVANGYIRAHANTPDRTRGSGLVRGLGRRILKANVGFEDADESAPKNTPMPKGMKTLNQITAERRKKGLVVNSSDIPKESAPSSEQLQESRQSEREWRQATYFGDRDKDAKLRMAQRQADQKSQRYDEISEHAKIALKALGNGKPIPPESHAILAKHGAVDAVHKVYAQKIAEAIPDREEILSNEPTADSGRNDAFNSARGGN